MKGGDKASFEGKEITFNKFVLPKDMSAMQSGGKFRIGVNITVSYQGKEYKVEPYMENEGQGPTYFPAELKDADLRVSITAMNATNAEVSLLFSSISKGQTATAPKEILTVDASIKPFISLVWIGVLTMVAGFIIASFRRSKESLI